MKIVVLVVVFLVMSIFAENIKADCQLFNIEGIYKVLSVKNALIEEPGEQIFHIYKKLWKNVPSIYLATAAIQMEKPAGQTGYLSDQNFEDQNGNYYKAIGSIFVVYTYEHLGQCKMATVQYETIVDLSEIYRNGRKSNSFYTKSNDGNIILKNIFVNLLK